MEDTLAMFVTGDFNYFLQAMKIFLGFMAIIYFIYFYLSWNKVKYNVSVITFYAITKVIKKGAWMILGVSLLLFSFVLEIIILLGLGSDIAYVGINVFQVMSLCLIGFSFYSLMRTDIPLPLIEGHGNTEPISSLPINEINKINGDIIQEDSFLKITPTKIIEVDKKSKNKPTKKTIKKSTKKTKKKPTKKTIKKSTKKTKKKAVKKTTKKKATKKAKKKTNKKSTKKTTKKTIKKRGR